MNLPVPDDMQSTPPVPCGLKVGDVVIFENDYGAKFKKIVRGFRHPISGILPRNIVFLDMDCWWFPVKPESLTKIII